jgi:hypothetical protein
MNKHFINCDYCCETIFPIYKLCFSPCAVCKEHLSTVPEATKGVRPQPSSASKVLQGGRPQPSSASKVLQRGDVRPQPSSASKVLQRGEAPAELCVKSVAKG